MTDVVDIGDLPNDGTGDPLRVAFDKINLNFANLALLAPTGPEGSFQFKDANGLPNGTANFSYDVANNIINIGGNLVPTANTDVSLGSPAANIAKLYLAQDALRLGNITVTESGNTISFPVTVFPSTLASLSANNLTASGNLSVGGSLTIERFKMDSFDISTSNNAANQVVYQIPANQFNTGKFQITSREANSNNSQTVTLVVSKRSDNLSASFSAFGTVFVNSPVTRYNADVGFGNVRIMVSPIPNTTVTHTITYQNDM